MRYYICESDYETLTPAGKSAKILDDNGYLEYELQGRDDSYLYLGNFTLGEREDIRKLLDSNGITLGRTSGYAKYKPTKKVNRSSNKRLGSVVSERIKKATQGISPSKPQGITPTRRYASTDNTVRLEYDFTSIGCYEYDEDGLAKSIFRLDDKLFERMKNAMLEECENLKQEGLVLYYDIGDYHGKSITRGGWTVVAANDYVEDVFPED